MDLFKVSVWILYGLSFTFLSPAESSRCLKEENTCFKFTKCVFGYYVVTRMIKAWILQDFFSS